MEMEKENGLEFELFRKKMAERKLKRATSDKSYARRIEELARICDRLHNKRIKMLSAKTE